MLDRTAQLRSSPRSMADVSVIPPAMAKARGAQLSRGVLSAVGVVDFEVQLRIRCAVTPHMKMTWRLQLQRQTSCGIGEHEIIHESNSTALEEDSSSLCAKCCAASLICCRDAQPANRQACRFTVAIQLAAICKHDEATPALQHATRKHQKRCHYSGPRIPISLSVAHDHNESAKCP